jgi:hypothetical protein
MAPALAGVLAEGTDRFRAAPERPPKPHRLAEHAAAADVALTADEVAELTATSDSIEFVGGRYPDALEAQTNL